LDLDPEGGLDAPAAVRRLNRVLPDDLVVWELAPAPAGFDARFAAVWRRYVYRLAEPSAPVHPLYRRLVTPLKADLDLDRLNAATPGLLGLRDFGAFCHSMVRSLVGALVEVGTGRRDSAWLAAVTAGAARNPSVPVLPPGGLTLEEVGYPPEEHLAARTELARRTRSRQDLPEGGRPLQSPPQSRVDA
ncbi:MAG TPA: tRNA pseudouridine(38-40) synthase TruA, partial [Propionibacteriaceae bacterium]|nr:tRNA pseudouridine(38-40) synthase TruA [Propionibacteriaceae bacterium]